MVVRLSEGREAIQAYVTAHASRGLNHVLELVEADNNRVLMQIGDLTEAEGMAITSADERVFDALNHMAASLDRSKDRLQRLSCGQTSTPPALAGGPGAMGSVKYASFAELRRRYIDGMADILASCVTRTRPESWT